MRDGERVVEVSVLPAATAPPVPIDLRWEPPPPTVIGQVVDLQSTGMVVGQIGATGE